MATDTYRLQMVGEVAASYTGRRTRPGTGSADCDKKTSRLYMSLRLHCPEGSVGVTLPHPCCSSYDVLQEMSEHLGFQEFVENPWA